MPARLSMGMYALRELIMPDENPVYPANAPCTAECAIRMHRMLSCVVVGTARTWYVGSRYLVLTSRPRS